MAVPERVSERSAAPVAAHERVAASMRVQSAIRSALVSPALRQSGVVWLLTRLLFVLLTYLGVILFRNALHAPTHPSYLHDLLPSWNQWDVRWYTNIARRGYAWKKAAG